MVQKEIHVAIGKSSLTERTGYPINNLVISSSLKLIHLATSTTHGAQLGIAQLGIDNCDELTC